MHSLIRPRPLAAIAIALLVVGGASLYLSSAKAAPSKPTTRQVREAQTRASALKAVPTGSGAANLVLGSKDSAQPDTMEQFLTAVTTGAILIDRFGRRRSKDLH